MYIFNKSILIIFLFLFVLTAKISLAATYNVLEFEGENIYKGMIASGKIDPKILFSYQPNGSGTMYYKDKSKYIGRWDDGLRNNKGLMIYSDKSQYDGIWSYGKRIGKATFTLKSGKKFTGEFNYGYFGWGMYKIAKINDIWNTLVFWYYNYFENKNFNVEKEDNIYFNLVNNKKLINNFFEE